MLHVHTHEDCVKIMDNGLDKIGMIVTMYFRKGDGTWCGYCDKADCIHVQYAWDLSDVGKVLRELKMVPPSSKVAQDYDTRGKDPERST